MQKKEANNSLEGENKKILILHKKKQNYISHSSIIISALYSAGVVATLRYFNKIAIGETYTIEISDNVKKNTNF